MKIKQQMQNSRHSRSNASFLGKFIDNQNFQNINKEASSGKAINKEEQDDTIDLEEPNYYLSKKTKSRSSRHNKTVTFADETISSSRKHLFSRSNSKDAKSNLKISKGKSFSSKSILK